MILLLTETTLIMRSNCDSNSIRYWFCITFKRHWCKCRSFCCRKHPRRVEILYGDAGDQTLNYCEHAKRHGAAGETDCKDGLNPGSVREDHRLCRGESWSDEKELQKPKV